MKKIVFFGDSICFGQAISMAKWSGFHDLQALIINDKKK